MLQLIIILIMLGLLLSIWIFKLSLMTQFIIAVVGVVLYKVIDYLGVYCDLMPFADDPNLIAVKKAFNSAQFDKVEQLLLSFSEDYRTFAFEMLSEMDNQNITKKWIEQSNSEIPQIIFGLHLIDKAWKVRSDDFAETINFKVHTKFQMLLQEAIDILINIENKNSPFEVDRLEGLLLAYKGISIIQNGTFEINDSLEGLLTAYEEVSLISDDVIDDTFQQGIALSPYHIGLHTAYFDAISLKWNSVEEDGSDIEEIENKLNNYVNNLTQKSELLFFIIKAMYYGDLLHFDRIDDDKMEEIRVFIAHVLSKNISQDNLHCLTLYVAILNIARVFSPNLEKKYIQLIKECYDLKWYQTLNI